MKIGTLSFERHEDNMALPSSERVKIIENIVLEQSIDILLCAGHTVGTLEDLDKLSNFLKLTERQTAIFLEVHRDAELEKDGNPADPYIRNDFSRHSMHLLYPNGEHQSLGGQIFSTSHQIKNLKQENCRNLLSIFEKQLKKRLFTINGITFFSLCCGELNILSGRDNPKFLSKKSEDIIMNATHDLMGNVGTVISKRKTLSQNINNKKRGCFSISNWMSVVPPNSSRPKQNPYTRTLHMGFISGDEVKSKYQEKKMSHMTLGYLNINYCIKLMAI